MRSEEGWLSNLAPAGGLAETERKGEEINICTYSSQDKGGKVASIFLRGLRAQSCGKRRGRVRVVERKVWERRGNERVVYRNRRKTRMQQNARPDREERRAQVIKRKKKIRKVFSLQTGASKKKERQPLADMEKKEGHRTRPTAQAEAGGRGNCKPQPARAAREERGASTTASGGGRRRGQVERGGAIVERGNTRRREKKDVGR